jgi:hypothetical protein
MGSWWLDGKPRPIVGRALPLHQFFCFQFGTAIYVRELKLYELKLNK